MAYVIDGSRATYITEAGYRAKGYNPALRIFQLS
jgi:hypothetical protein